MYRNDEIDFDEFSHCFFHNFMTTDDMNLALYALDQDGNGKIDVEESIKIQTAISGRSNFGKNTDRK